ncbi:MAG: sugar phosphate isomerase/epimerase family protein, partial [Chitinophagales bacterium]
MKKTRRTFLQQSGRAALALTLSAGGIYTLTGCGSDEKKVDAKSNADKVATNRKANRQEMSATKAGEMFFKISLAEWSLHRTIFDGKLDHLDFATKARKDFGIEAVEYVNQFFKDKAEDNAYLKDMKKRADDAGVKSLLIMIDGEGNLGDLADKKRKQAVENHYKWVDAAKFLGCHSIRVNAAGEGNREDVAKAAIDGLGQLSAF